MFQNFFGLLFFSDLVFVFFFFFCRLFRFVCDKFRPFVKKKKEETKKKKTREKKNELRNVSKSARKEKIIGHIQIKELKSRKKKLFF